MLFAFEPTRSRLVAAWKRWLPLLPLLALTGCLNPIGADQVGFRKTYQQLNQSALNGSDFSSSTLQVLHRYNLETVYDESPAVALKALHGHACADDRRELLYALAELNYAHADDLRRSVKPGAWRGARDYYFATAIYAYLYLLGDGPEPPPGPFARKFRAACDFYNRSLAESLVIPGNTNAVVELKSGPRTPAPGPVAVEYTQPVFKVKLSEIEEFVAADAFRVRGLTVRDRQSGLGAPLIGVGHQADPDLPPRRMPATVFLRVNGDLKTWQAGQLTATLELYSIYDTNRVMVAGRSLPLECDVTAPVAYAANDARIWQLDLAQFLSPKQLLKTGVYLTQPYQAGRIPVVFVHGTASSPIWWAEMWNTLRADSVLRERYQFWYFTYNTGKPTSTSAADFRAALLAKIAELDPEGKDPALRQMVIVGHSQGGLLASLTATDTGDKLWRTSSDKKLEDLPLTPEVRADLQRNFFFTPLPCVSRVVFLCTPHRGSYRVTRFVLNLARRFMDLPADVVKTSSSLMLLRKPNLTPAEVRSRVPTSLDLMSPKNPWLLALADIPVAPGIKSHSIIAIRGDDEPPAGSDGVVKYTSAHLDYTESEFIVRSGHSCQSNPATIEEVRRILLEHLRALAAATGTPAPALDADAEKTKTEAAGGRTPAAP